ncbi:hypothetical protein D3C78_1912330 [compost metagenome]
MHRCCHREIFAEGLLLRFQIRQVLEVVRVHVTVRQQLIGVHTVGDLDHFEVQLRVDFLYVRQNLRMRHRVCRHA